MLCWKLQMPERVLQPLVLAKKTQYRTGEGCTVGDGVMMLEFPMDAEGMGGVGGLTLLSLREPVGFGFLGLTVGVTVAGVATATD